MFKHLFVDEVKYRFRQPATWIYFFLFLALGAQYIFLQDTSFGPSVSAKIHKNSPFMLASFITGGSFFTVFIIASLFGTAMYKDQRFKMDALILTAPITMAAYFWGRYLANLFVAFIILTGSVLGCMLGLLIARHASWLGPFSLQAYLVPLFVMGMSNYFFFSCIFYGSYAISKSPLVIYLGGVLAYVLYLISNIFAGQIVDAKLASMVDPVGFQAWYFTTQYWTIAQKNTLMLPLGEYILPSKILWCTIGLVFLLGSYFYYTAKSRIQLRTKKTRKLPSDPRPALRPLIPQLTGSRMSQWTTAIGVHSSYILRSWIFWVLVFISLAFLCINAYYTYLSPYSVNITYPVSYQMISLAGGGFLLFMLIIIIIYSGELVWKERDVKMQEITSSLPMLDWTQLSAKFFSLVLVIALVTALPLLLSIAIQLLLGFHAVDLPQYALAFLIQLLSFVELAALSMAVHVIINNRYVAYAGVMVYYVVFFIAGSGLGIEHLLLLFGKTPPYTYSDMNGLAHFAPAVFWPNVYYLALSLLLLVISWHFWTRAQEDRKTRMRNFVSRFESSGKWILASALVLVLCSGFVIYQNTNVWNRFLSSEAAEKEQAEKEKAYSPFATMPLPKIESIQINVDIYPREHYYTMQGRLMALNKTPGTIRDILLSTDNPLIGTFQKLSFSGGADLVRAKSRMGYLLYHLRRDLKSGDSLVIDFSYTFRPHGFSNRMDNPSNFGWAMIEPADRITNNGTFIGGIPLDFGYQKDQELLEPEKRKKYGLGKYRELPLPGDSAAVHESLFAPHADRVSFRGVLSTDADQIALAPGKLISLQKNGDRKTYIYSTGSDKITAMLSFLSARYRVSEDSLLMPDGKKIRIAVYHDPKHPYNISSMELGVRKALAYNNENFGPFQFSELRILEFPRYKDFAQSFAGTVPFSEGAGFITDLRDSSRGDGVFYITAHEVGHQWWGHQLVGDMTLGSNILSENLADYSAVMAYRHQFGEVKTGNLLRGRALRSYLRGRAQEKVEEKPLYLAQPDQSYLMYGKGILVMNRLQDEMGEARMNGILKKFLETFRFRNDHCPSTLDYLRQLNAGAPDSLHALIHELYETITLYDNRLVSAVSQKLKNGKYEVTLQVKSLKSQADRSGVEKPLKVHDWMDLGVFGSDPVPAGIGQLKAKPILIRRVLIDKPEMKFTFVLSQKPYSAAFDPFSKIIDKQWDDNMLPISSEQ